MKIFGLNAGIGPSIFVVDNYVSLFWIEGERASREDSSMGSLSFVITSLKTDSPA